MSLFTKKLSSVKKFRKHITLVSLAKRYYSTFIKIENPNYNGYKIKKLLYILNDEIIIMHVASIKDSLSLIPLIRTEL